MTEPGAAEAVLAVNSAFYAAFETGDLDAMHALWVADEPICVHPGSTPVVGDPAVRRSWAVVMANTPYIQFFLTDVEVAVLDGVASVTCTENVLAAGEDTPASAFAGGKSVATNVFRRTPSGWRLWIHHASPILSPQQGTSEAG